MLSKITTILIMLRSMTSTLPSFPLSELSLIPHFNIHFTLLRQQDEAYINSTRWSTAVELELAFICISVDHSTNVLRTKCLQSSSFRNEAAGI